MIESEVRIISTVSTSLKMFDQMTKPLQQISNEMNAAIVTMDRLASSANQNVNISNHMDSGSKAIKKVDNSLQELSNSQNRATNEQNNLNNSFNTGASASNGLTGKIKGLIGAYLGFQSLKNGIESTDNYINQNSRLLNINDGLQSQEQLQNKIYQASQRSRGAYSDTVSTVAKLGLLAKDAFSGNDETIAFAELMNKSFKVSGASISEASNGMYQLTQAMAAGRLQGDEFRSVMENAPLLAQAIAKYTGKSMGDLREMSSEGKITSQIIKNSLFSAANDINAKFETMPRTFGSIWTSIKNKANMEFSGIMQSVNNFINSSDGSKVILGVTNAISILGATLGFALELIMQISSFVANNWGTMGPIIWGIVAAMIAYNVALGIGNIIIGISTGLKKIHSAATMMQSGETFKATAMQWGLNTALLACPLTWIVIAIIAVIVAIVAWSAHTNGLKATWLMFTNVLLTALDSIKIGAVFLANTFMNSMDWMLIAASKVSVGIQNALGDMKAGGLMILQGFVNGAIDLINELINKANKIPGVSIETLNKVTFGTEAMVENVAKKSAKNKELSDFIAEKEANKQARQDNLNNMIGKSVSDLLERQANINAAKEAHAKGSGSKNILDELTSKLDLNKWNKAQKPEELMLDSGSKNHLKNIDDKIDISNEQLELMRDLAEQESIQNFVTLTPTVQVTTGDIKEEADINKIITKIENYMQNELIMSAEGVYA